MKQNAKRFHFKKIGITVILFLFSVQAYTQITGTVTGNRTPSNSGDGGDAAARQTTREPTPVYDFYDYKVSGTENWTPANNPLTRRNGGRTDGTIKIRHSLTIPANARLAANNMCIEMGPQGAITIEAASAGKGGQLVLNAATLTAYGNNLDASGADKAAWEGIIVENSSWAETTDSAASQGSLIMNGSTVSYATAGVQYGTGAAKAVNKKK